MAEAKRLRDRMREDLVLGGMSASTVAAYVHCARRLAEHVVRVMGALFRGKMLDALERAHARRLIDVSQVDLPVARAPPEAA